MHLSAICSVHAASATLSVPHTLCAVTLSAAASNSLVSCLQAMIDFEEDVPVTDAQRLQKQAQDISSGVKEALDTASKGRLLKAGLQVSGSASLCMLCTMWSVWCILTGWSVMTDQYSQSVAMG